MNGVVAWEWELSLPAELDAEERDALTAGFAAALVARYGVAADHASGVTSNESNSSGH